MGFLCAKSLCSDPDAEYRKLPVLFRVSQFLPNTTYERMKSQYSRSSNTLVR